MITKTQKSSHLRAGPSDLQDEFPEKIQKPRRKISQIFFFGAFMGFCDLVPGISGGTIAYLFGFYDELLGSFAAIGEIFKSPKRGLKAFFSEGKARFWFFLALGDILAILVFSKVLHIALEMPWIRAHLFSFFLGLIVVCTFFYLRGIRFNKRAFFSLFLGFGIASALMVVKTLGISFFSNPDLILSSSNLGSDILLFVAGMLASIAMLLPGISGSTLLLIVGLYSPLISALALFSESLFVGQFDMQAFTFLSKVGLGVLVGFLLGARSIRFCLARWENNVMALLSGFILGSLPILWPFRGALSPIQNEAVAVNEVGLILGCGLMFILGAFLSRGLGLKARRQKAYRG